MTRKHFKALANALAKNRPDTVNDPSPWAALEQWQVDVQAIADACCGFNPNYDRERFLEACGFYEEI